MDNKILYFNKLENIEMINEENNIISEIKISSWTEFNIDINSLIISMSLDIRGFYITEISFYFNSHLEYLRFFNEYTFYDKIIIKICNEKEERIFGLKLGLVIPFDFKIDITSNPLIILKSINTVPFKIIKSNERILENY